MAIRLARAAHADLAALRRHIGQENPAAATRIAIQILAACDTLEYLPERGRPGRYPGTREIAAVWPYVIVYRIEAAGVVILRIWHGAQER